MPCRAVVFDLDGLLFNTEDLYVEIGTELLARRGRTFTAELRNQMMGRPGKVALQIMIDFHRLSATVDELQRETDELYPAILERSLAPLTGVVDLLAALEAADLPKAVATSSRRAFVQAVLGRFDWESRFRFLLTAEDVTHGKPHPEIYRTAAARLMIEPEQMVVCEDSGNGCRAAVTAGAVTIAVPGPHSADHDFSGVSLVADTLADPRLYSLLGLRQGPSGP